MALIQCSSRVRCSSRAGSAPVATRMARRCSTGLLGGIWSRAWWVSGRSPLARLARTAAAAFFDSQPSTVRGRSAEARVWWSTRSSARMRPVPSSSSCRRRWSRVHRVQRPEARSRSRPPQVTHGGCGNGPAGRHAAHSGVSTVPPRTARTWPHPEQRAQRCWQAVHQGWPVAVETVQGTVRPQIAQSMIFQGRQLPHSGPSAVRVATRLRRRQATQSSRLAGSLTRQFGHNGPPSASRAAGSRALPQREQGTALVLATQPRQTHWPSCRLASRVTRWQRGQAGRVIFSAPASHRQSISRSTPGTGACAPSPVSRPGWSSTTQASRRS